MTRAPTPLQVRLERFRIADKHIKSGGSLRSFAREIGISPPGALFWMRRNDPDRLAQLVSGPRTSMSPHDALVRLLWLKATEGMRGHQARVCRALGLSPQRMAETRRKWAPDGLDAAIADLMPDDGDSAHG